MEEEGFATLIIALEYEWYVSAEHPEIAVGWGFLVFFNGYLFVFRSPSDHLHCFRRLLQISLVG